MAVETVVVLDGSSKIPIAEVPTGTGATQVSLGNHAHSGVYEPADANIQDAVTKRHTQGTDQGLDTGGASAVTAAQCKQAVTDDHTHTNKSTLDTYTQTEVNLADAVSKKHSNTSDHVPNADTDLDATFEATLEKVANKGAVSGYAPVDAAQKVPTANLGGAGADNTKYLRGDQSWQVPSGGGGSAVAEGRPAKTGTVYLSIPGAEPSGTTVLAIAVNTLYHEPIYVATQITLDQLVIEVTTLAAGAIRLGIYTADTDWQPVALVLDAGTVDTSTTGVKTISINQVLAAGRYLLVLVGNATPSIRFIRGGSRFTGLNNALGTGPCIFRLTRSFTYSTLPATPSDWTDIVTGAAPFSHFVFVRISTP